MNPMLLTELQYILAKFCFGLHENLLSMYRMFVSIWFNNNENNNINNNKFDDQSSNKKKTLIFTKLAKNRYDRLKLKEQKSLRSKTY